MFIEQYIFYVSISRKYAWSFNDVYAMIVIGIFCMKRTYYIVSTLLLF